jgi:hypothetical protein
MLAGWRRLRTLTTSLSQGLDAVIDGILQVRQRSQVHL